MVRTYASSFPLTENPISEAGGWLSAGANGTDWTDVRTTPGKVFGTESGISSGSAQYDDSHAALKGVWGADQGIEANVFVTTPPVGPNGEVELHLRRSISAKRSTGYEFTFGITPASVYIAIVRWNGLLGDFLILAQRNDMGVTDGDVVAATVVGSTLTAYKNGTNVLSTTDATFNSGAPGLGFFLRNNTGTIQNWGFTHFACNDAGVIPSQGIPTNGAGGIFLSRFLGR